MRHGGSDIEKFFKGKILKTLLDEAISHADMVVTNTQYRELMEPLTPRLIVQPAYVPNDRVFTPRDMQHPQYRLAVIGKINYHWQHKNLTRVIEIMGKLTAQFECWVVGQGKGMLDFKQSLDSESVDNIKWLPFVPPWEMPVLLRKLDAIFVFESELPHHAFSNLALEALSSGVGIITDRIDFKDSYQDLVRPTNKQILFVPKSQPASVAGMIIEWIQERYRIKQVSEQIVTISQYLSATEEIYEGLLTVEE